MKSDLRGNFDLAAPDPDLESNSHPNPDEWRDELAARLARYRTRRKPRAPRYPSLLLPFDSASNWSRTNTSTTFVPTHEPVDEDFVAPSNLSPILPALHAVSTTEAESDTQIGNSRQIQAVEDQTSFANVIEFPRSAAIPISHDTLLADPIIDRPRIVEAPEIVPPPPALGGILIESPQPELPERRLGAELSIVSVSIPRRLLAAALDVLILVAVLSACGAIFLRLNPIRLPLTGLTSAVGTSLVILWMIYQYMFIVSTGSTPGLRATRLRIATLDGSAVSRRRRRWRVLASFLSAFAAGLGYLWCFLDQDSFCWHDRITRTHIQSAQTPRES